MKRLKLYVGLAVLFFSGVVVGAVGSGIFVHQVAKSFRDGHGQNPIKMMILTNAKHRLDLDEATMQRLGIEIDASLQEVKQLRKDLEPRIEALVGRFQQRTKAFLNESQQAGLVQLMDDLKHRRHDKLKGPGWPFPPPPPPLWDQ